MADDPKKVHDFLKKHPVGVLATVTPNGEPHAATIYFDTEPSLHVLFVSKTGTKKADNLRHKDRAMLVVYEPRTQTTAQISGKVEAITDESKVNDVFVATLGASLETSGRSVPPIVKRKNSGDFIAYRMTPEDVQFNEYGKMKPSGKQELIKPPKK